MTPLGLRPPRRKVTGCGSQNHERDVAAPARLTLKWHHPLQRQLHQPLQMEQLVQPLQMEQLVQPLQMDLDLLRHFV